MTFLKKARYAACFSSIALLGVFFILVPLAAAEAATPATWNSIGTFDIGGYVEYGIATLFSFIPHLLYAILLVVGYGFDQSINFTVINFASNYDTTLAAGVIAAWSSFRDIANIILIAMFVFLALNVILGIQAYGLKKFGVQLVIVAVLINFSLFFTQAIIDISNLLAITFYNSISVEGGGIAGAALNYTGMTTFGSDAVFGIINDPAGGYLAAALYALINSIFFTALSAVLLFGLILLVTRMVTFIVLMLLSAPAFASMLIPGAKVWWDRWLNALLKNAVFAPVFMLLLWASVNIMVASSDLSVPTKKVDIAAVITSSGGWSALFNVFIVVGLLYASTIIANGLSIKGAVGAKKVGLGLASKTFVKPLSAATAGSAALLGRETLGRASRAMADSNWAQRKAANGNLLTKSFARGVIATGKSGAKATYDARNTKPVKDASKAAGLSFGKAINSYDKHVKSEAEILTTGVKAMVAKSKTDSQVQSSSQPGSSQNILGTATRNASTDTEHLTAVNEESTSSQSSDQNTQIALNAEEQRINAGTAQAVNQNNAPQTPTVTAQQVLEQYRNRTGPWKSAVGSAAREGTLLRKIFSPDSTRIRIMNEAEKMLKETPEDKQKKKLVELESKVNKLKPNDD